MEEKYINTIEDFMKAHPELDPSLKPVVEPMIMESEEQLFNWIMSYIFM